MHIFGGDDHAGGGGGRKRNLDHRRKHHRDHHWVQSDGGYEGQKDYEAHSSIIALRTPRTFAPAARYDGERGGSGGGGCGGERAMWRDGADDEEQALYQGLFMQSAAAQGSKRMRCSSGGGGSGCGETADSGVSLSPHGGWVGGLGRGACHCCCSCRYC